MAGTELLRLSNIRVILAVKRITEKGRGTAVSTDSGGTEVFFTKSFINVDNIEVTAKGTTAIVPVYDFTDVPNPTSFKVLLFDLAGSRVSGEFSWSAGGI
jgi:hypothetical protein